MVAGMVFVPLGLGALFHDVIPGEDFLLFIFVEQIERCAAETKYFGFFLGEFSHDSFAEGIRNTE